MKRRNFLKGVALGTAAGVTMPIRGFARESNGQEPAALRSSQDALVERFSHDCRVRSGIALGGIGAGCIELRKDGRFYNWTIFNNFPKETGPKFVLPEGEDEDPMASNLFFKVRYEIEGEEPKIKLLQLPSSINEGGEMAAAYIFPWMEAVDQIDYAARFPFAKLSFSDVEMPFDLEMEAWTPFIPHDVKNSALPLVFFDFTARSKSDKHVHVMLLMVGRNNAGFDTSERFYTTAIKESVAAKSVSMSCGGMDEKASTWGQITISSLAADTTYYSGWSHLHPYYEQVLRNRTLPDIDDTLGTEGMKSPVPAWLPRTGGRNHVDPKTGKKKVHDAALYCTLAKSFELNATGAQVKHSFLYCWNFPNLYAETVSRELSHTIEGHYYSNYFETAGDVAEYAIAQRDDLLKRSREFLFNFFDSSADSFVLEQVNSHLNTFVTSGRLVKSGDFGILEGLSSTWSWGPIATIDVMLYGTASVIALFPDLQKATMRCHQRVQSEKGEIQHGLLKNFHSGEDNTAGISHRLDLPGQYVILVLRDFLWTNDKEYLRELYPSVKKAIDYILDHRSFNGDQIPIMRGIESSYDNFPMYGYSAYIVSQWLCAIASAVLAAEVMGDLTARSKYEAILTRTRERMEEKLWNGRYYRLYNDDDTSGGKGDRSEACLTDQLVGQWMAHTSGLGHLLKKENIDAALKNILLENYKPGFGLRNCSWPGTKYWSDIAPDIWVDQGNTCWSGVELAFASFLLYEGFYNEALNVIRTVDQRYRKNGLYWTHQEFGGHYLRPMSSWAVLNGLLGFSINRGRLRFDPQLKQRSFKLFFATPSGTGHFLKEKNKVALRCKTGTLTFSDVEIKGTFEGKATLSGNSSALVVGSPSDESGFVTWKFERQISLAAGEDIWFQ
jgi:non-lysosomal glucosylceramidase